MDPRFQTSFIPKKPIVSAPGGGPKSINFFALLATVIFVGSLLLTGGVFFYKSYLEKGLKEDQAKLEAARKDDDPNLIKKVIRLDSRIETSEKLIASHIAVSPFFNYLSTITLRSVRFKDFDFSYLNKDNITVSLAGEAQGYEAVALQSDLLVEQEELSNVIIGDLALRDNGRVEFSVNATVKPALLSYAAMYKDDPKGAGSGQNKTQTQNKATSTATTTRP
jgi:hypothetical protein